jgi:hypothetical protein
MVTRPERETSSEFLHDLKASAVPYNKKPARTSTGRFCRECFPAAEAAAGIRRANEIIFQSPAQRMCS